MSQGTGAAPAPAAPSAKAKKHRKKKDKAHHHHDGGCDHDHDHDHGHGHGHAHAHGHGPCDTSVDGGLVDLQGGGGPRMQTAHSSAQTAAIAKLLVTMDQLKLRSDPARSSDAVALKSFEFWSTQPVPKMDEQVAVSEAIDPPKEIAEIRQEPYSLPAGFRWDTLDLDETDVLSELYTLLTENYVEDEDCMFRFDYQPSFLKWALRPTGWRKQWYCGIRTEGSGRLVGFIAATPANVRIYERSKEVVEINFLCVHKKLRSKRVAPVLIREITRRVNLTGIFQGVYTAGVVLPKPIATCRYWHRSLNPKKLIQVEFSRLSKNRTMQRTIKLLKLPDEPKTVGFRKLRPEDCVAACAILNEYLLNFQLAPVFTEEEFRYWFVPRQGIVDSYVVEGEGGGVTDFVSYYSLPSTVMNHPIHKTLYAAYSFYNVSTKTPWVDLMTDALITAKNAGFDVFNALDLMDNKKFLQPLKFGIGDGDLQYYLYNWKCPQMIPEKVGLVLL